MCVVVARDLLAFHIISDVSGQCVSNACICIILRLWLVHNHLELLSVSKYHPGYSVVNSMSVELPFRLYSWSEHFLFRTGKSDLRLFDPKSHNDPLQQIWILGHGHNFTLLHANGAYQFNSL